MTEKEEKENFCGACVAAPAAFIGAGIAGSGMTNKKSNKKMKKILLCTGITITVISIFIAILYLKSCKSCR